MRTSRVTDGSAPAPATSFLLNGNDILCLHMQIPLLIRGSSASVKGKDPTERATVEPGAEEE